MVVRWGLFYPVSGIRLEACCLDPEDRSDLVILKGIVNEKGDFWK